jgi:hypothetical protein
MNDDEKVGEKFQRGREKFQRSTRVHYAVLEE